MLCPGPFREHWPAGSFFACRLVTALVLAPITNEEECQNAAGDNPCKQCVHRSTHPHSAKTKPHHNHNMQNCKECKGITKWPVNNVPKMEHPLRLIEKQYTLR